MKKAMKKLTIEDYATAIAEPNKHKLLLHHVNEVISIHGFCKARTKPEGVDCLLALDPMSVRRSTVGDPVAAFPCAPLTLEEVKTDVRAIGWDECPIGSLRAVTAGAAAERAAESPEESMGLRWTTTSKRTRKRTKKRKEWDCFIKL